MLDVRYSVKDLNSWQISYALCQSQEMENVRNVSKLTLGDQLRNLKRF